MPQSPQITGGEFSYMRRVKTGDYEHAEAKALLNFSTPEGSDYRAVFDEATNASVSQVLKVLGLLAPYGDSCSGEACAGRYQDH